MLTQSVVTTTTVGSFLVVENALGRMPVPGQQSQSEGLSSALAGACGSRAENQMWSLSDCKTIIEENRNENS